MKKYLKLQAKKSVSLLLAVLMVLSCWVWMAPEVAQADQTTGQYKIRVIGECTDNCSAGMGTNIWRVDTPAGNTTLTAGHDWSSTCSAGTVMASGWANAWPTNCHIEVYSAGEGCDADEFRINNVQFQVYNFTKNEWVALSKNDGFGDQTGYTYDWGVEAAAPTATSLSGTMTDTTVKAPAWGSTDVKTVTTTKVSVLDQYGVTLTGEKAGYSLLAGSAKNEADDQTKGVWLTTDANGNPVVNISAAAQENYPSDAGTYDFYLQASKDGVTDALERKITVSYSPVKFTFDAAGSIPNFKPAITVGENTYVKTYSTEGYFGATATTPAFDGASAGEGYTFLGFWSEPQPSDINSSAYYYSMEEDFAYPIDTASFNSLPEVKDANGNVMDYRTGEDGKKYYPAGEQWNPNENKTFNGNKTYYGWWVSKDLIVKFYDVDGKFLGEYAVKNGQTHEDITWPESKYLDSDYKVGAFSAKVSGDIWVDIDGSTVDKNSYTFSKNLILTPYMDRSSVSVEDTYPVKFIDVDGNTIDIGDYNYAYRADISESAQEALGKFEMPAVLEDDKEFGYDLIGWSSAEPYNLNPDEEGDHVYYHVLVENGNFDVEGTAISANKDWIVRGSKTYYPVYKRYTKTYKVQFHYMDATGTSVYKELPFKYGYDIAAPTDYVPLSYVLNGYGYSFIEWKYDVNNFTFEYTDEVDFTSEYFVFTDTETPIIISAVYSNGVPTPYTVTFNFVDGEGENKSVPVTVDNGKFVTDDTEATLAPAGEWENEDKLYYFEDVWEITDGKARLDNAETGEEVGQGYRLKTENLSRLSPKSNLTIKAVYESFVPYYTVTYVDGANTKTYRDLKDAKLPKWTVQEVVGDNGTPDDPTDDPVNDKDYIPKDYEVQGGKYIFQGWFDAKEGGNKIDVETATLTSNITLYSQFKFEPFKYTIKFMNHDGSVQLAIGQFEKGQNIEPTLIEAIRAAQAREADETYTYEFLGWDKTVPTFCEGYNVTYTAMYREEYKYYNAKWYNAKLENGKWVADTDDLYATTKHTYESKLYAPSSSALECNETAPNGQRYVFAGWYYLVNNEPVKYVRGMTITSEMEFYATYTLTDKTYTVTTVVGDKSETYTVAANNKVEITKPQDGYVGPTNHNEFVAWYIVEDCDCLIEGTTDIDYDCGHKFDLDNTKITENIKLYAKFKVSKHTHTMSEKVKDPTYYEMGEELTWCTCDKDKTKMTKLIPILTDDKAPTGTIYLGGQSWSSTDEQGAAATDGKEPSIFVNANSDVVIAANDDGIGVKTIRAFAFPADTVLTADNYGAARQIAIDVYTDTTTAITNSANFSIKLGDVSVVVLDEKGEPVYEDGKLQYQPLESGKAYIIYYYVNDKATEANGAPATGNQLNKFVRTAKFIYDSEKPVFEVTGDKTSATVPTYCTVTVTGIERDVIFKINGEAVKVNYAEGEETGTYEITWKDGMYNVVISAEDKAGNIFTKKIRVINHNWVTEEVASTCDKDGYKKVYCSICDKKDSEETYYSTGHEMGMPGMVTATCDEYGYEVTVCENCGYKVVNAFGYTDDANNETLTYVVGEDGNKVVTEDGKYQYYLYPALGHEYAMDDEGNIVFETVTASTCITKGTAEAVCSRCNEKITKTLELDPANHCGKTKKTELKATCTHDGYLKLTCNDCKVVISEETYPALGHTTEWVIAHYAVGDKSVEYAATCYQPGKMIEKCTRCTALVGEATEFGYTADADNEKLTYVLDENGNKVVVDGKYKYYFLPATGEHVKAIKEIKDGKIYYCCATEGCTYADWEPKDYVDTTINKYTVTFKDEAGNVLYTFKDVEEGSAIKNTEEVTIVAPEMANSDDGVYKYSFAGWADAEGNIYKVPFTVTGDLELKATYKATEIKYTHQFLVPTTWEDAAAKSANSDYNEYALLVGVIGDEKKASGTPVFKSDDDADDYTYTFAGWYDVLGNKVEDFRVTYDGETADKTFYAKFSRTIKTHKVTYYSGSNFVWQTTVDTGSSVTFGGITPTKAKDNNYHYSFNGKWYTDSSLKEEYEYKGEAITAETRLYAGFNAFEHTFVVNTKEGTNGIIQAQTCTDSGITAYICSESSCGHTKTETVAALGHEFVNYEYDDVSGEMVAVCEREGCNETDGYKSSVTIKFVNENGVSLYVTTVQTGTVVEYAGKLPEKDPDNYNTYVFAGWMDADGNVVYNYDAAAPAKFTADKDAQYKAFYTSATRYYTVIYANSDDKNDYVALQTFTGLEYGVAVPGFTETVTWSLVPDQHGHKTVVGWNIEEDATVTGDMIITPKYDLVPHTYENKGTTGATCTEKGGIRYECACGYGYTDEDATSVALGHDWVETSYVAPDYTTQTDGSRTYKCKREGCKATKTEVISGKARSIKVTVNDANGNPIEHAEVRLLKDGEIVAIQSTNDKGITIFSMTSDKKPLDDGKYSIYVVDTDTSYTDIVINEDGTVKNGDLIAAPEKEEEIDTSCQCTCHKNTFWGMFFRFFQKIIKLFTGKASCCACPSDKI